MNNFINYIAGQYGITSSYLWSNITLISPLIIELCGLAFGFAVICNLISSIHRLKNGPKM